MISKNAARYPQLEEYGSRVKTVFEEVTLFLFLFPLLTSSFFHRPMFTKQES
jgi:hypothetical protein